MTIIADPDDYAAGSANNPPPPPIPPKPPGPLGVSPMDQAVQLLQLAISASDPYDAAELLKRHANRSVKDADAAQKFPNNDDQAAQKFNQVGTQAQDPMMQLAQMVRGRRHLGSGQ